MLAMNKELKKRLLRQAHSLRPVVMLGNKGFTDAVLAEMEIALDTHELIKIKVAESDRDARAAMITSMCEKSGATLVSAIGKMAVLYRKKAKE